MSMEGDKLALRASQAGMRFIAQTHLYNQGDFARLLTFITDSYHAELLASADADARLADFQALHDQIGKLRVLQTVGAGKHHVMVLVEAEQGGYFLHELRCEEDYPHKITAFTQQPIEVSGGGAET